MEAKAPLNGKHDPVKEPLGIKHDPAKEEENPWGRVTLCAFDGVIIEQNVSKDEMMSDPTINLWQIADVSRLLVIANCPEDDLPTLESLQGNDKRLDRAIGRGPATGLFGANRRDQLRHRPQSAHGGHQGVC